MVIWWAKGKEDGGWKRYAVCVQTPDTDVYLAINNICLDTCVYRISHASMYGYMNTCTNTCTNIC